MATKLKGKPVEEKMFHELPRSKQEATFEDRPEFDRFIEKRHIPQRNSDGTLYLRKMDDHLYCSCRNCGWNLCIHCLETGRDKMPEHDCNGI